MQEEKRNDFECRKCKTLKPISDFIKDRTRKTGHHPYCRKCQNKIKNTKASLKRSLEWQKENKDRRKIIRKKWYDNNPELIRIYANNRRVLEKELSDNTLTKESLKSIPRDKCGICNEILDWSDTSKIHLDHIIPLAIGGLHSINNVQWTHSTCNLRKGKKRIN